MSQIHEIRLEGCTPEPLMNYLKALGILRLVSEQKDSNARGKWKNDVFVLQSSLDHEELSKFFLEEYSPSSIMAPWGARSGFYKAKSERTAREALKTIIECNDKRFSNFKSVYRLMVKLLGDLDFSVKPKDKDKLKLLQSCRERLPDSILKWLDTTYVLTNTDRIFPPILGTGGNEGSGSYVSGFTQQIVACLINRKHDEALATSLLSIRQKGILGNQSPGHFSPNSLSGPNSSQGLFGPTKTNPWDYIFCIEGTCLWASNAVKQLNSQNKGMASFPFTVKSISVGSGSLTIFDGEKGATRAEMWLPMWGKYIKLTELKALLSEGRVSLNSHSVHTGLDMARAAASLGVDRGINSFNRFAFVMRNGQSFLASYLGRFPVLYRSEVDLLNDVDDWHGRFSRAVDDKSPPRFRASLYSTEKAIFTFCQAGGSSRFADILRAFGKAEKELSKGESFRSGKYLKPLGRLSPEWLQAANDGSVEFELALSLAGICDAENKIGSLRTNLEPVIWKGWWNWSQKDRSVVWNSANLSTNLAAVLTRRIMDGGRVGCLNLPLAYKKSASLESISAFLYKQVDERKLKDFLWGFLLIDNYKKYPALLFNHPKTLPLPRVYALLKLLFLPAPLVVKNDKVYLADKGKDGILIRPEPRILPLLKADRLKEACEIAVRRLRASGIASSYRPDGSDFNFDTKRLAASLLFTINSHEVNRLVGIVCDKEKLVLNVTI